MGTVYGHHEWALRFAYVICHSTEKWIISGMNVNATNGGIKVICTVSAHTQARDSYQMLNSDTGSLHSISSNRTRDRVFHKQSLLLCHTRHEIVSI